MARITDRWRFDFHPDFGLAGSKVQGALLLIFVTLWILLRSFKLALLATIPNALPLVFMFAALYALGTTLQPANILISSIVLGLAVDDTIHVFARFRLERAAHPDDYQRAVFATLEKSGLALLTTTAILVFGSPSTNGMPSIISTSR